MVSYLQVFIDFVVGLTFLYLFIYGPEKSMLKSEGINGKETKTNIKNGVFHTKTTPLVKVHTALEAHSSTNAEWLASTEKSKSLSVE